MKMKKAEGIFFAILFVLGTAYLALPAPKSFPHLPGALKSTEPGDTVQIANVSAYYTDMPRQEAIDFYFDYFSHSPFFNFPLPTYKLNHPPERIKEILRDTQQSTYVEELVHPFRESVFISGFEWDNDPFTPPEKRIKNILLINGKTYRFKVTLFYQESALWQRLLVFYLVLGASWAVVNAFRGIYQRWQREK